MIRQIVSAAVLSTAMTCLAPAAFAKVQISIDITTQRMHVTSSRGSYTWKVSTGRGKYTTPRGNYRPTIMKRMHYSRKYDNSPMPYSIFFRGGYAIHGTKSVRALGRPASHGCVRLSTRNAAKLFRLVKREGASIRITGSRDAFYANNRKRKSGYASRKRLRNKRKAWIASQQRMRAGTTKHRYAIVKRSQATQQPRVYRPVNRIPAPRGFIVVNSRHAPLVYAQRNNVGAANSIYFRPTR